MKIKEIERPTQEYSALIYLYDEATKNSGDNPSDDIELAFETLDNAIDRAKKVEEFISLCYVETTDTGHEVVFWRDENYEYAKQLLKILKEEMK